MILRIVNFMLISVTLLAFADPTEYPCFTAFQAEIAGPAQEYANEQDCCPDNTWYHLESDLSWNQSLDEAIGNYDDCCRDSDELGC